MSPTDHPPVVTSIHETEYLRERLTPRPDDALYLHLSDLRLALQQALPQTASAVLDYGCGGSPYRSLFPHGRYYRADIAGTDGIDYAFGDDSRLTVADATFDCVLSTQVLEHVSNPNTYLQECRRVLQPGKKLILTTHGTYPDHACPYDFWRWTADGLRLEIERAGLKVTWAAKLTTGPRALLFLNQQFAGRLVFRKKSFAAAMLRLGRIAFTRLRRQAINTTADEEYQTCRVVPVHEPGHELYIAQIVTAERAG
jgi:SAM-dependent methyltransferase